MNLPKYVDPFRLCKQQAVLTGEVRLSDLPRVQAILDQGEGTALVTLIFGDGVDRLFLIKGDLKTVLSLNCEWCNGALQYEMNVSFSWCPVTSDAQAKTLPDACDPVLLVDEQLMLLELIEDEILLNLPMVARHPEGKCTASFRGDLT